MNLKQEDGNLKARLGMWLFLMTELTLFSVLFISYSFMRYRYAHQFHSASEELSVPLGVLNTFVLLTSSLFFALSENWFGAGEKKKSSNALLGTFLLGLVFLGIKAVEWGQKIHHDIYPGSKHLASLAQGENIFFDLYFVMTGLHGLHVIGGLVLILVLYFKISGGRLQRERHVVLHNSALYWHFVDIVWVFLLPLFYLSA